MSLYFLRCALLTICLLLFGCAGFQISNKYKTPYAQAHQLASHKQTDAAIASLETTKASRTNSVLHHLQLASLYTKAGYYQKSNEQLEQAKQQDAYLRKISVSEHAGSLLLNDTVQSYTTSNYERYWLFILKILNYAQLQAYDAVGVELRQLDLLLQEDTSQTQAERAFVYYFAGIIYEVLGKQDDALIAYRHAYQAYGDAPPTQVRLAYARMLLVLRVTDEVRKVADSAEERTHLQAQLTQNGCVLFFGQGQAPMKRPNSIRVIEHGVDYTIDIPHYPSTQTHKTPHFTVAATQQILPLTESIDKRVRAQLTRATPAITAKTIARVVAKKVALMASDEEDNIDNSLSSLFVALTEGADLRSWHLLPAEVFIVRYYTQDKRCVIDTDAGKIDAPVTNRITLIPFFS